jgi:hypothetical protein
MLYSCLAIGRLKGSEMASRWRLRFGFPEVGGRQRPEGERNSARER